MGLQNRHTKIRQGLYLLFITIFLITSVWITPNQLAVKAAKDEESETNKDLLDTDTSLMSDLEPYYFEMQQQWKEQDIKPGKATMDVDALKYKKASDDSGVKKDTYSGEDALIWSSGLGWVDYDIDVPDEGLYEIEAAYHPLAEDDGGSNQSIILGAEINGEYQHKESRSIELKREYRDQDAQFDDNDNQIRSLVEEIDGWKTDAFRDSGGAHVGPLLFHLKKGKNTIRLHSVRDAIAIKGLTIREPRELSTYETVKTGMPEAGQTTGDMIDIEAEQFTSKNSTSIQVDYDRDPVTTPKSMEKIKFNTLGGTNWGKGRQAVKWEFEVPEDGTYKFGFRGQQNYRKNLSVFRSIYIDGQIPFEEMKDFKIPYATSWQEIILGESAEKPYDFYLEKGVHTLTMEVNYEPFIPILIESDKLAKDIRKVAQDLRLASGDRKDSFRVWNVEKEMPDLIDNLNKMQQSFESLAKQMIDINGRTSNVSQAYETLALDISTLLEKPDEIPNKQVSIGKLQERLEDQRQELMDGPLQIDTIYVAPVDESFPTMTANWYEKIAGIFYSLIYSFSDQNELAQQEDKELNVWMMWGRDYAEELQQLADQQFTPEHGIKVNVNLIQDDNLLVMAKAAGIMPDIALGVPNITPFEMALRGAAKDLSELPGAEEVLDNYAPGTLTPYFYDGGYYGIPETLNFKMLFYRKDILRDLDLDVPDTWDDVYEMLPTLLQNQYNFYVDPKDFSYMLYQNDVELYTDDGMSSGLDQGKSVEAFEEWTDLFNLHGMDREVKSFYQQFRKGTFPIGIADFNDYMQLLVAAPEILDVWGVAPIPGHVNDDGDVVRWAGGTGLETTSMMLFNDTPDEKQAIAWDFMKWYTSTDVQTQYGRNLEQFRGETFRWNSANIEAFAKMPWKQEDLKQILEQWKWIKENPNVPGSYMTTRQLEFSWNQTVLNGENPRTELEKAVKEINRELRRKQSEFDLRDEDGNVQHTLDLLDVRKPWEGGEDIGK